jgi:hypothetical protein
MVAQLRDPLFYFLWSRGTFGPRWMARKIPLHYAGSIELVQRACGGARTTRTCSPVAFSVPFDKLSTRAGDTLEFLPNDKLSTRAGDTLEFLPKVLLIKGVEILSQLGDSGSIPYWSELTELNFLKNHLAGEAGVREFSKLGFDSLLLLKTVGQS